FAVLSEVATSPAEGSGASTEAGHTSSPHAASDEAIARSIAQAVEQQHGSTPAAEAASGETKAEVRAGGRRFGHSVRLLGSGINFLTVLAMGLGAAGLAGMLPTAGPEAVRTSDATLASLPASLPASPITQAPIQAPV